jgi:hypothetical protein
VHESATDCENEQRIAECSAVVASCRYVTDKISIKNRIFDDLITDATGMSKVCTADFSGVGVQSGAMNVFTMLYIRKMSRLP